MSKTISEPLFWLLCLKQFLSQVFNLSFCILSKVKVLSEPWEVWHLGYFLRLMPAPASVSDNYNRSQRKGRFPSLTLVWTKWRQAGRHAMVVDLAHPDCGLLSLSVVHPLCEQSQHREEGEHGGGTAVTLLHIIWECGGKDGFAGHWETHRQRQRGIFALMLLCSARKLFIPHSDFMSLCDKITVNEILWKSLKRLRKGRETSTKPTFLTILSVVILDKNNHLYHLQRNSTCWPHSVINPLSGHVKENGRCYFTGLLSPVV